MEPLFAPGGPVDLALPFTIRMEVRPREEPFGSLPRILSAYDGDGRELFFLGQWRAELVVRILAGERLHYIAKPERVVCKRMSRGPSSYVRRIMF